jgi:hypothetical protein
MKAQNLQAMMNPHCELYRYQYVSGELEFGRIPLPKHGMALETVMIEDFMNKEKLNFASSKGNMIFKHEYMWIPEPDGVVTVFKLRYERETAFSHCVIVASLRPSSPFILIWGYDKSLKWAYEALSNALNSAFRGRGVSLWMTPCNQDADAKKWMIYMEKTYEKAKKHKDNTTSMLKQYESMTLSKKPADFRSCVNNSEKADLVIGTISKYMKGKHEPRDIIRPIAAAIAADVIRKPTWKEITSQFHLDDRLESSYYRLIRDHCKTYFNSTFNYLVEEFRLL